MVKRVKAIFIVGMILFNITCTYAHNQIDIDGKTALLMEAESGEIIFSKNIHQQLPPASITKLMTYLVTMDAVKRGTVSMGDEVIISERADQERGASYRLETGEMVTLHDLVKSMMIVSANDSAVAIAEHVGGSVEEFVKKMNEKGKEIGLEKAHFVNPNGMPEKEIGNIMTTRDIGILSKYLIDYYGEDVLTLTDEEFYQNIERNFYKENTNGLLKIIDEVDGLKTGYTDEAGYCLASTMHVKRQETDEMDFRLISVILGTESEHKRVIESKKLLNHGVKHYTKKRIVESEEFISKINLWGAKEMPIQLLAKKDVWALGLKTGIEKNRKIELLETMPYPIDRGQKLGELKITLYNDKEIKVDLVSDRDVNKIPFKVWIMKLWPILKSIFQ